MSPENLEVVKEAVVAFNERDVERFAALTATDFEWLPSMSPIEGGRFLGHDGVRRYFGALGSAWESFQIFPAEFREHREGVLVLARLEGRGKGSGATVDASLGMAFDLRDAKISRIRGYLDQDEALKAVGLEQ
ncbi:MAG TPA: nuclear transport factor 2 family protein [Solirubrobacteraceae bacterium]|nr:nuclear transport factor 2 family protein [Solirubrobacteraceae bacterium]